MTGLLDHVVGVDAFRLEVPRGQLTRPPAGDRSVGSLTEDPCERGNDTVEVVRVLLRELPVVRARVDVPALALGCGSPLAFSCEYQDVGNLHRRADDIAEPADQLAPILSAHRDMVIVADKPAEDRCGGVGSVLAVTPQAPLVRCGDLGFDVSPAGRNRGHTVGGRGGGALPQRPTPRAS